MKIPFIALILQGIPESVAIVTLSFIIAKIPFYWKRIVIIGLIMAFTSYFIRLFPVTFGIHTVLIIGLEFLLLVQIGKGNINASLIASIISSLAIIIVETVSLITLMPLFGVTSDELVTNTATRILMTLPQVFVMFALAYIVFRISKQNNG